MNVFLVDNSVKHTLSDLIFSINNKKYFYPKLQTVNLYEYFVNLIVGLITNNNITLVDSGFTTKELDYLGVNDKNQKIYINKEKYYDIDNIISKIQISKSIISIFTSGTTGQPKVIKQNVNVLRRFVRSSEKHRNKCWALAYNPTHIAGIQVFLQAFENKNALVNVFEHSKEKVFELINKYKITHISGTPTFYRLLLPCSEVFHSVENITFGGERSDELLYTSMRNIFPNAKITNIYASTEAGSLFFSRGEYFVIPKQIEDKVKIINNELLIHKSLLGYSENFIYDNEYYNTGDLVELNDSEKNVFKIVSRKNELINTGGYKVNPLEIEQVILQIPQIKHVYVYGKNNSITGKLVCADVVKYDNEKITDTDIKHFLRTRLQNYKIPRLIKFVKTIKQSRSGKTSR